jgi:hypothetical protein
MTIAKATINIAVCIRQKQKVYQEKEFSALSDSLVHFTGQK